MSPRARVPRQYAMFKSTLNEYLSYKGPRVNLSIESNGFRVQYCYPHEMLFRTTQQYLERPWHPYKILLQRKWDDMSTAGLWKFINCGLSVGQKAVVRRFQAKRLRRALGIALKEKGMDADGMRLDHGLEQVAESPIKGSLMVIADKTVNDQTFDALVTGFTAALDKIERGRRASKPRGGMYW
jgi:hypothetical protein